MACVDQTDLTGSPTRIDVQPILLIAAGFALGLLVAFAADVPVVEPAEDWHGNVRASAAQR